MTNTQPNSTAITLPLDSNLVFGFMRRVQGVTRRMNQLSTNDPKRAEMAATLIRLEALIASHSVDESIEVAR